jgi:hypothetical protein
MAWITWARRGWGGAGVTEREKSFSLTASWPRVRTLDNIMEHNNGVNKRSTNPGHDP